MCILIVLLLQLVVLIIGLVIAVFGIPIWIIAILIIIAIDIFNGPPATTHDILQAVGSAIQSIWQGVSNIKF